MSLEQIVDVSKSINTESKIERAQRPKGSLAHGSWFYYVYVNREIKTFLVTFRDLQNASEVLKSTVAEPNLTRTPFTSPHCENSLWRPSSVLPFSFKAFCTPSSSLNVTNAKIIFPHKMFIFSIVPHLSNIVLTLSMSTVSNFSQLTTHIVRSGSASPLKGSILNSISSSIVPFNFKAFSAPCTSSKITYAKIFGCRIKCIS
uniref:Uncharacterized protein n=1 Tax=Glossina brevipalpis TaxID=37001 RepID=A0A1A9W2T2_9MUSC